MRFQKIKAIKVKQVLMNLFMVIIGNSNKYIYIYTNIRKMENIVYRITITMILLVSFKIRAIDKIAPP